MPDKSMYNTLEEPIRLGDIPKNSQWLSGEGAGSWFHLSELQEKFLITRYSPQGKIECSGVFQILNKIPFDINLLYHFTHLSHCKSVHIIQKEKVVKMERIILP